MILMLSLVRKRYRIIFYHLSSAKQLRTNLHSKISFIEEHHLQEITCTNAVYQMAICC